MKPRVYIDTSVVGGYFDPQFKEWSNKEPKGGAS